MKPASERLNDRLEGARSRAGSRAGNGRESSGLFASSSAAFEHDPEVEALVAMARQWQSSPQLQATPDFAGRLERHLLQRQAFLRREQPEHRRWFPHLLRMHPALSMAFVLCFLMLFLGTGVLVMAAQVSNPGNPLYAVKNWEQQVQVSLAGSPTNRATLDMQFARERLGALTGLTGTASAETYRQTLANFEQQLSDAASAIQGLPSGPDRARLSNDLESLKADARHTLRALLPRLALAERLLTTDELGRLGETVPRLLSVEIVLPVHPNEQATISVRGEDIQPGAQLLVNGQVIQAQGVLQNGAYVFTASWHGSQQPQSVGILNPDDTAAQTATITLRNASGSEQRNGNGNGNTGDGESGQHGNGDGRGKPGKTPVPNPTPHH